METKKETEKEEKRKGRWMSGRDRDDGMGLGGLVSITHHQIKKGTRERYTTRKRKEDFFSYSKKHPSFPSNQNTHKVNRGSTEMGGGQGKTTYSNPHSLKCNCNKISWIAERTNLICCVSVAHV